MLPQRAAQKREAHEKARRDVSFSRRAGPRSLATGQWSLRYGARSIRIGPVGFPVADLLQAALLDAVADLGMALEPEIQGNAQLGTISLHAFLVHGVDDLERELHFPVFRR